MTVDIRAVCTCSLGELISASISDDYMDGGGLVRCKGTCEIKGVVTPTIGSSVSFGFTGPSNSGSVPRTLYVIGYSCNPFKNQTTVTLGCKLTLRQDFSENIKIDGSGDTVTETGEALTAADEEVVTKPIRADFIANYCATKLGVTGSFNLKSQFSIAAFDLSPGYFQILSDLLASECKAAYAPNGSALTVFNISSTPGGGAAVSAENVIEISPLGIGAAAAETVSVTYNTLKLVDPDTDDLDALKWEKDESIGLLTTVTIPSNVRSDLVTTAPTSYTYTYIPKTITITEYDLLNRVKTRETTEYTIAAVLAPTYVQYRGLSTYEDTTPRGSIGTTRRYYAPPEGSNVYTVITKETFTYSLEAPTADTPEARYLRLNPPTGYEEVLSHETYVEEPKLKLIVSTQVFDAAVSAGVYNFSLHSSNSARFIAERTIETTAYGTEAGGKAQITKTFYDRYKCFGYTQEGQQAIAAAIGYNDLWDTTKVTGALNAQFVVKSLGREINISTGYKLGLQQRPLSGDLNAKNNTKGGSSNYRTEQKSETLLIGSGEGAAVTFNLPYAPDDTFIKISSSPPAYKAKPADPSAESVARAYGNAQNRLRSGGRLGMNIVLPASAMPSAMFAGIAVSAGGAAGAFVTNGTSWTLSSEGAIASTDALFIGGLGAG